VQQVVCLQLLERLSRAASLDGNLPFTIFCGRVLSIADMLNEIVFGTELGKKLERAIESGDIQIYDEIVAERISRKYRGVCISGCFSEDDKLDVLYKAELEWMKYLRDMICGK